MKDKYKMCCHNFGWNSQSNLEWQFYNMNFILTCMVISKVKWQHEKPKGTQGGTDDACGNVEPMWTGAAIESVIMHSWHEWICRLRGIHHE